MSLYCETSFASSGYSVTIRPIRGCRSLSQILLSASPPSPELAWNSVGIRLKTLAPNWGSGHVFDCLKPSDEINLVSMQRVLFGRRLETVFNCLHSYPWMKCPDKSCGCGIAPYCVHPTEPFGCVVFFECQINSNFHAILFALFCFFFKYILFVYFFPCWERLKCSLYSAQSLPELQKDRKEASLVPSNVVWFNMLAVSR